MKKNPNNLTSGDPVRKINKCKLTALSLSALPLSYLQSSSSRERHQCPDCCWGSWGCFPGWCWDVQRWPWCNTGHLEVSSLDLSPTSRINSYTAWEGSPQWPGGYKVKVKCLDDWRYDERRESGTDLLYLGLKVPGGIINPKISDIGFQWLIKLCTCQLCNTHKLV